MGFKQAQEMPRRDTIASGKFLGTLIGIRRKTSHRIHYSSVDRPELPQNNRFEEPPLFVVTDIVLELRRARAPKIFHLRRDPFERADENSNTYYDWMISHAYIIYAMQAVVAQQVENFRKFPPRQKPASFNLDAVMRTLVDASGGGTH